MSFLNNNKTSVIEIKLPVSGDKAEKIKEYLTTIIENTTIDDMYVLSRIVVKPAVKIMAIQKAKEYI